MRMGGSYQRGLGGCFDAIFRILPRTKEKQGRKRFFRVKVENEG